MQTALGWPGTPRHVESCWPQGKERTSKALRLGAQRCLVRQLSVQPQHSLVDGVHDGIDEGRAAGEVPAAAQRDLLCAACSQVTAQAGTPCPGQPYPLCRIPLSQLIMQ